MITQERLKELFEYNPDTGLFIRRIGVRGKGGKAGTVAGTTLSSGYITISVDGEKEYAHRLAFLYMTGEMPEVSDHINRVRSDNRWHNLRSATIQENNRNVKRKSKSGYTGVVWNKRDQRWYVQVQNSNGKYESGGCFTYRELDKAVASANTLRAKLHGERAIFEEFTGYIPNIGELNK